MRPDLRPAVSALAAAAVLALTAAPAAAAAAPDSFTIEDPRIKESSGLVASRLHPGVYWTHNDSDDGPYLYGVDAATGRTVARVTMTGVGSPRDVEAISLGPDGRLYVGDIGDNRNGSWDHVWIYRLPEPRQLGNSTVKATQFTVRYADGPRNAEALMVHPVTGRVYIASKNEDGGGLYEGPAQLAAGGSNTFRRVAEVPWVTDGAFSPDGKRLTLRGYFFAETYAWQGGRTTGEGERVRAPFQPQAESVAYAPGGTALMFGSEGSQSRVVAVPVAADGPAGGGSGTDKPRGGAAAGPAAAGDEGSYATGAMVLALAVAVVFGLKRLVRRGG
ncbi:WD40 repeat domain-containing protein [Streptomyces bambusae]|uniref:WD40 repeat domain-containing protein n=1 Tax=Streptomyces bambusae TaxID=1550616 RepID=UPI001CFEFAFE|nr:WD40 repeat domain-containing protein [Streptomyces bambusae]MCB5167621.1 WD40 repeat domain-containing protein [Streptomyces bambusae]